MTPSDSRQESIEPIRVTVRVRRSIEDAFDLFTRDVNQWWPLERASFGGDRAHELHLEPFVGGRFYERYTDGEEHAAGQVLRWEPPHCIAYTWRHDDWARPTEVEVRFIAETPVVTRVELEHRSWNRLGPVAAQMRDMYQNGWPAVVGCFESVAGAA